jgi:hypothetical protein
MAATKTQPKAAPPARDRAATTRSGRHRRTRVDRAERLSEDVFTEVEAGQRAAIKAVRQFVDTVDRTLPASSSEEPSKRQTVVDAAMEMADQLVHAQYDFLRKVVRSAGTSLGR